MNLEIELCKGCVYYGKEKEQVTQEGALVKWNKIELSDENGESNANPSEENGIFVPQLPTGIFVWMTTEEIAFCCPSIMDNTVSTEKILEGKLLCADEISKGPFLAGENEGLKMTLEVNNLVQRARKLLEQFNQHTPAESLLANTMSILNAYAKIRSLSDCFRTSGAIDLVVDLLSGDLSPIVRQNASELARTLSAGDSPNKMYILLKLTEDKKDNVVSTESIDVVLDVFLEISAAVKNEREGMCLPQVHIFIRIFLY